MQKRIRMRTVFGPQVSEHADQFVQAAKAPLTKILNNMQNSQVSRTQIK